MIQIIPFSVAHALDLEISGRFPKTGGDSKQHAEHLFSRSKGLAFSAVEEGEVIGCAGIVKLWEGVGEAWTMLSSEIRKRPFFLHRQVKRGLQDFAVLAGFHRVELFVVSGFEAGNRWAISLGFQLEGVRKAYTPDKQDITVYTKFF